MFKEECCKHCRHVTFRGTMTTRPVQKLTHKTTQKDASDIIFVVLKELYMFDS